VEQETKTGLILEWDFLAVLGGFTPPKNLVGMFGYLPGCLNPENRGRRHRILTTNELNLTFQAPNNCENFIKLNNTCSRRSDYRHDRQMERQMQVIL